MFNIFKKKETDNNLYAPVTGEMIDIETVADKVFSSKMMGDGVAFQFEGDTVCAPCDGILTMIASTKHAFGITMDNGAEILVHIGLDTVELKGQGLEALASVDKKISKGTPVIKIDRAFMKSKEIDLTTPVIVTNLAAFNLEKVAAYGNVTLQDKLIQLTKK